MDFAVVCNSQAAEQCRDDVAWDKWVCSRKAAYGVAATVDQPGAKSATDHHQAVTEIPMVTAGLGVDLGCATEIPKNPDNGPFEHPAATQIFDEAAGGSVELR